MTFDDWNACMATRARSERSPVRQLCDRRAPLKLAKLLDALQSVANNDEEIEAVLLSMLYGNRVHFVPAPALSA